MASSRRSRGARRAAPRDHARLEALARTAEGAARAGDRAALERAARELLAAPAYPAALAHAALSAHHAGLAPLAVELLRAATDAEPAEPAWWNNLANVLSESGRIEEAVTAYRRALARAPEHHAARYNLGKALQSIGEAESAVECFRAVVRAHPRDAGALTALGNALLDAGDADGAVDVHRRAVEIAPEDADALNDLGLAHMDRGDFEAAAGCYRRALGLRTDCARAALNLAKTRRFADADAADVQAIERCLAAPGLPERARVDALFALGKVRDDLGRHDDAFELYREANAIRRRDSAYSRDGRARWVDRLVDAFDAAFFERVRGFGDDSPRPVLVVGMPRSGTTLVEQILASHPRCFGAGELPWLERLAGDLARRAGDEYPEASAALDAPTAAALAATYLERAGRRAEAGHERVVDKMPSNFYHLGLAAALLPGARVIHLRRSPMDVALSLYFHQFAAGYGYAYDLEDIAAEIRQYRRVMAHWAAVLPLPLLEIDYETLVADQEAQSRRLVEFCGLEWDPACLEFHRTERAIHTASNWQVRQPIYARSVERWRRYERQLRPLVEALGEGEG